MKKNLTLILFSLCFLFLSVSQAQEDKEKATVKPYGYVSYELIYDTHDAVVTRDADLYLYPKAPNIDPVTGDDLNENGQLEMLSLNSRVGLKAAGLDALGAKTSAVVEGDFFATAELYKHQFRIRHAFMKMQWEKASLLMGQYWHPMFTPEVFPKVIAFGAAVPYNPLNRSPQVRFEYQVAPIVKIAATALAYGYHNTLGPSEFTQRYSGVPDMQFQTFFGDKKNLAGFTAGYMMIEPRLPNPDGSINENTLGSYNLSVFGKVTQGPVTINAKFVYGQNMTQYVMLGGYGVQLADTGTNDFNYTPYKSYSVWGDVGYKINDNLSAGVFFGYMGLLGTEDEIDLTQSFTRSANLDNAYRISPRVVYSVKHLQFALEYLYSSAAYGVGAPDANGVYSDTEKSNNNRILFCAKFKF